MTRTPVSPKGSYPHLKNILPVQIKKKISFDLAFRGLMKQHTEKSAKNSTKNFSLNDSEIFAGAPRVAKLLQTPHQTMLSRGGGRIVGGTDATYGEFPHQIALLYGGVGGSFMCGGSLVSNNYVVTAAHCCDG
jgi:hypothetical protein